MEASGFTPQEKMFFEEKGKEMGIDIMNLVKFNDHFAKATIQHRSDKIFKVFPVREMMIEFPDVLKIKLNYNPEKDFSKIEKQIRTLCQNEARMNSHHYQTLFPEDFPVSQQCERHVHSTAVMTT